MNKTIKNADKTDEKNTIKACARRRLNRQSKKIVTGKTPIQKVEKTIHTPAGKSIKSAPLSNPLTEA